MGRDLDRFGIMRMIDLLARLSVDLIVYVVAVCWQVQVVTVARPRSREDSGRDGCVGWGT